MWKMPSTLAAIKSEAGDQTMPTGSVVFLIFTGAVTFAVLLQTVLLLAFVVGAKQAQRKAMEEIQRLHELARPVIQAATGMVELVENVAPRVRSIAENLESATVRLRDQVDHIDSVVQDMTGKTRQQVVRIDHMVTDTLDVIARGTRTIQENVMAPLRQVGGWMTAMRTGLDLFGRGDRRSRNRGNEYM